jgi:hypothetical protein
MGTGSILEGHIAVRSVTIRCHRLFSTVTSAIFGFAGGVDRTGCEIMSFFNGLCPRNAKRISTISSKV